MIAAGGNLDDDVSDGDLARRIAAGADEPARREEALLVERFARRVRLYGLRHLRDADQAADLAQDVMRLVLERLRAGEVREPERIGSFILGTARMMARDARRRWRRQQDLGKRVAAEAPAASVGPAEGVADLDRLEQCLQALTERERTVVVLSFQGGEAAPVIAGELGLSPANVRVIRHRAVARLRTCMGASEEAQA
jgi:RNA polymerase sigma-70 factor, ECF subfamily